MNRKQNSGCVNFIRPEYDVGLIGLSATKVMAVTLVDDNLDDCDDVDNGIHLRQGSVPFTAATLILLVVQILRNHIRITGQQEP